MPKTARDLPRLDKSNLPKDVLPTTTEVNSLLSQMTRIDKTWAEVQTKLSAHLMAAEKAGKISGHATISQDLGEISYCIKQMREVFQAMHTSLDDARVLMGPFKSHKQIVRAKFFDAVKSKGLRDCLGPITNYRKLLKILNQFPKCLGPRGFNNDQANTTTEGLRIMLKAIGSGFSAEGH